MPETASDRNSNTFSGGFQGQHQWLGNSFNTQGDNYINPSSFVQAITINFPSIVAIEESDNHTHSNENDRVGALVQAHVSRNATRDSAAGRSLRADGQVATPKCVRCIPEVLATLDTTIRRA